MTLEAVVIKLMKIEGEREKKRERERANKQESTLKRERHAVLAKEAADKSEYRYCLPS